MYIETPKEFAIDTVLPWKAMLSAGAFNTVQAARLTGRKPAEVGVWLRGPKPVIAPDYEPVNGRLVLSFEGLIEARVVGYFVDHAVTLRTLREVMERLRRNSGERHPLARDGQYVTDGFRTIKVEDDKLINLANDVYLHPEAVREALKVRSSLRGARDDADSRADRSPLIVIDPRIAFGRSVVLENGHAVSTAASPPRSRSRSCGRRRLVRRIPEGGAAGARLRKAPLRLMLFLRLDEGVSWKIAVAARAIRLPQDLQIETPHELAQEGYKSPTGSATSPDGVGHRTGAPSSRPISRCATPKPNASRSNRRGSRCSTRRGSGGGRSVACIRRPTCSAG
jgi:hypothetical protein